MRRGKPAQLLSRTTTIGDVLVNIGGISKSILSIAFAMTSIFSYKLFVASIMSKW